MQIAQLPKTTVNDTFHDDSHASRSSIFLIFGQMTKGALFYLKMKASKDARPINRISRGQK